MLSRIAAAGLKAAIGGYRLVLSPVLPASCRFEPSCSLYAIGALDRHGPAVGVYLAVRRILRCQPWGGCGYDPVPDGPIRFHARRRSRPHRA